MLAIVGLSLAGCDRVGGRGEDLRMAQDSAPPAESLREPSEDPTTGPREPTPTDTLSLMLSDQAPPAEMAPDTGPRPVPREPRSRR